MQPTIGEIAETRLEDLEVIEFTLSYPSPTGAMQTQSFGINVAKVREIIRMPNLTSLPNLPSGVRGIFNLRNHIIPAVDLAFLLFDYSNVSADRKMIVSEFNRMQFGFIVNEVARIHRFEWSQVESPDAIQDFDPENASIIGIIKTENRNILMVDVEKIIADVNPQLAIDDIKTDQKPFGAGLRVITADDSPTIRKMVSHRLKLAGFEIEAFRDGQEALKALEEIAAKVAKGGQLSEHVNLVVTDVEMPQMDGYTLTDRIRKNPILANLPVIIFSSLISDDILHKGKRAGATAQLTKPQLSLLLDTVLAVLNSTKKAA